MVAETDITNLYEIPINQRYRVYFAGLLIDFLMLSCMVIFLHLVDTHVLIVPDFYYHLAKSIIIGEMFGILWQLMFFMETDVYYAFENFFRMETLRTDALQ